jgi:Holliday junction resolvase RusA-like endonuclease
MRDPLLAVTIPGLPQPQGSSRAFVRGGRAIVTSANPRLRAWRDRLALGLAAHRISGAERYDGPACVHARFLLPRPKSAPKRVVYPTTRPDLDKCMRSVGDALVEAGVLRDDSQIVEWSAIKCYAMPTEHPGVELIVWAQESPYDDPPQDHRSVQRH